MTYFCKTLANMCAMANITIDEAIATTTKYEHTAESTAHRILNDDFIPDRQTICELAAYFGAGIDLFFESPHASINAKKIYLAGSITGHPDYMERFDRAHKHLEDHGWHVFNPARASASLPVAEMTRQNFMDFGLAILSMCNAIALMPGWEQSSGVRMERAYAEANRMRVIELTDEDIRNDNT